MDAQSQRLLALKLETGMHATNLEAVTHQKEVGWVPVDAATIVGVLATRGIVLRIVDPGEAPVLRPRLMP